MATQTSSRWQSQKLKPQSTSGSYRSISRGSHVDESLFGSQRTNSLAKAKTTGFKSSLRRQVDEILDKSSSKSATTTQFEGSAVLSRSELNMLRVSFYLTSYLFTPLIVVRIWPQ